MKGESASMALSLGLPFEREAAEVYRDIQTHESIHGIAQFRSLPSANQYRHLYSLTARFLSPGASVLDWGCGRGHFAYYLLKQGFRVTCYSLEDPPAIFEALEPEAKRRLTFVRGNDPIKIALPDQRFDAVFSVGVLEHVRETNGTEKESLTEMQRLLMPGGHLIVYHFPNRFSYIEALSRLLYGRQYGGVPRSVKFHKYLFSAADIAALVASTGFTLVEQGRYGFLPRNTFNKLPMALRSRQDLTSLVNLADLALEKMFAPIVQNFYFIARAEHH